MMEKTMTYSYILLVSAVASFDISHVAPIFRDVIFLLILCSGILMSLTLDHNRPDVNRRITVQYVLFSFSASVFFSVLTVAAYIEFNFMKFYLYILIGTAATLSPQFARKVLPQAPEELKKGAFSLFRSFIQGWANKLENNPKKDENETE